MSNYIAVISSPSFRRSQQNFANCLRFRYLCLGSGGKTLGILQDMSGSSDQGRRPLQKVWEIKETNNFDKTWKFGEVSIATVRQYKVRSK